MEDENPTWQELEALRLKHQKNWTAGEMLMVAHFVQRMRLAAAEQQAGDPLPALSEPALQEIAAQLGRKCHVWEGVGARDVEEVLKLARRAEHSEIYAALRHAGLMLVRTEQGLRIDPLITDATAAAAKEAP